MVLTLEPAGPALDPAPASGNFAALCSGIAGPMLVMAHGFADRRGVFTETYSEGDSAALGIHDRFVQDNRSRSERPGTVRGLHFQAPPRAQAKLVRLLSGSVLDVVVDLRRSSSSYGRHLAIGLDAADGHHGRLQGFRALHPGAGPALAVRPAGDRAVGPRPPAGTEVARPAGVLRLGSGGRA